MTSQYLMHCVLRKTMCTTSIVSERGEQQCGDPGHHGSRINSIETDYNDGYIINILNTIRHTLIVGRENAFFGFLTLFLIYHDLKQKIK